MRRLRSFETCIANPNSMVEGVEKGTGDKTLIIKGEAYEGEDSLVLKEGDDFCFLRRGAFYDAVLVDWNVDEATLIDEDEDPIILTTIAVIGR